MIFASFDSSMLDLSRTSATAVEHLKHYLEFAEQGPVALAQQSSADHGVDQFDSVFEQAVARELRAKGWKVQTQVGVSRFRIDLGIVHPSQPGNYLAGLECDGATYHSSPSARDRDRIRHIVLENLGWRLIRLWSTDYFRDPASAIDRIDEQLKLLLEQDKYQSETEMETAVTADKAASESTNQGTDEARHEPASLATDEATSESTNQGTDEARHEPASLASDEARSDSTSLGADKAGYEAVKTDGVDTDPSSSSDHIDESASIDARARGQADEKGIWPSAIYYESGHESVLNDMAREILTERPGITRRALALEIAERHGLSRTSKKQIAHLEKIINGWAGIWRGGQHRPVYWLSPDDVQEVIPWRGLDPFGYNRDWSEIAYPEALGLALEAIQKIPEAPIDYMFDAFQIKRRHQKTEAEFNAWIASARAMNSRN